MADAADCAMDVLDMLGDMFVCFGKEGEEIGVAAVLACYALARDIVGLW